MQQYPPRVRARDVSKQRKAIPRLRYKPTCANGEFLDVLPLSGPLRRRPCFLAVRTVHRCRASELNPASHNRLFAQNNRPDLRRPRIAAFLG
jgi:hypothetical protein